LLRYDEDRLQQDNEQKDNLIELKYLEAIEAITKFKADLAEKGEATSLEDAAPINSTSIAVYCCAIIISLP
jgi:hypothetical protein